MCPNADGRVQIPIVEFILETQGWKLVEFMIIALTSANSKKKKKKKKKKTFPEADDPLGCLGPVHLQCN